MIDRPRLLSDLQKLLRRLERDLLERSDFKDLPDVPRTLLDEHARATKSGRTVAPFEEWREDQVTQTAAAWVLSSVFVRFLEDNGLVTPPRLSGPAGAAMQRARDEHELFFRTHARDTDREYLLDIFGIIAKLPGGKDLFGPLNPVWFLPKWLSGDAATEVIRFFQKVEPASGVVAHDFSDPDWDTRFLGDLYQDLSEEARKKYALLQTPVFVEEFILDRTLDPALDEFGLEAQALKDERGKPRTPTGFRMMDPACGSGHFLLGSFRRILDRWRRKEPAVEVRDLVQRTLDAIHGVDLNPFAVAISRFRLLIAAIRACDLRCLANAPAFRFHLDCGDSLLHAPLLKGKQSVLDFELMPEGDEFDHAYRGESLPVLKRMLEPGRYHAVVANPPYITPKDRGLNERYRQRFKSCHMQYSLAAPFMEQIFRLAVPSGFTGQITANSFMKREYGKKLIEGFLSQVDITHVIDTQLAHIPGHGIPTVILFGRNREPKVNVIRLVGAIAREDEEPTDPSKGRVWSSIVGLLDRAGAQSDYVSVSDYPRAAFLKHPWSIGGGGAAELKEDLERAGSQVLGSIGSDIGVFGRTSADEIMTASFGAFRRKAVEPESLRALVVGDAVRNWKAYGDSHVLFPYERGALIDLKSRPMHNRWLWSTRSILGNRATFSRKTYFEEGRTYWEWHQVSLRRLEQPLTITFGEVATHNHFALDRGGNIFNQTAPVIGLGPEASEDAHLGILGALNSSTACFWLKQVCHCKGGGGIGGGIASEAWERFYAFNGTKLYQFPLPQVLPTKVARHIDDLATKLVGAMPDKVLEAWGRSPQQGSSKPIADLFQLARGAWESTLHAMVYWNEELDWLCYKSYGLTSSELTHQGEPCPIVMGQRAFEIGLAKQVGNGAIHTEWFSRNGAVHQPQIPPQWETEYRSIVKLRLCEIESNPKIALIERPEYKRRWNYDSWQAQVMSALRSWLLDRLEEYFDFDGRLNAARRPTAKLPALALISTSKLAEIARSDAQFMEAAGVLRDDPAFDINTLVTELVESESVPFLPILRYKESGLRKRVAWERTWELQRREDEIEVRTRLSRRDPKYLNLVDARALKKGEVGKIASPPGYVATDFQGGTAWRLRGKLDVPKERWVSFPQCEGPDMTPVVAWAGYDHLQLARAIGTYYTEVKTRFGGDQDSRLVPLLAGILELLPWIKQWHNDVDPEFNQRLGDYFEGFVAEEARGLALSLEQIRAWTPVRVGGKRGLRTAAKE